MINVAQMRDKATAKINAYGRTMSYKVAAPQTVYTDSVTGENVVSPIQNYNGELVNPATLNVVVANQNEVRVYFKGLLIEDKLVFGDYLATARYLGSIISEDFATYMIPADIDLKMGDLVQIGDQEYNVFKSMPVQPGEIRVFNIFKVKR